MSDTFCDFESVGRRGRGREDRKRKKKERKKTRSSVSFSAFFIFFLFSSLLSCAWKYKYLCCRWCVCVCFYYVKQGTGLAYLQKGSRAYWFSSRAAWRARSTRAHIRRKWRSSLSLFSLFSLRCVLLPSRRVASRLLSLSLSLFFVSKKTLKKKQRKFRGNFEEKLTTRDHPLECG